MTTCSIDKNGPVSPVPTATLPIIAASTTTHGWSDTINSAPARAESAASIPSAARAPNRSAGRRTAQVNAALPMSVHVTAAPTPRASMPCCAR